MSFASAASFGFDDWWVTRNGRDEMLSIDVDLTVLLILLSSRCVVSESASVLELESPAFCLIVSCAEIYKYASDHQASSLIIRLLHKRGSLLWLLNNIVPPRREMRERVLPQLYTSCAFVSAMVFLVLLSMVLPFSKNRMTSGMNYTRQKQPLDASLPTYQPPTTQQFSRAAYHITPTTNHHATIIQRF